MRMHNVPQLEWIQQWYWLNIPYLKCLGAEVLQIEAFLFQVWGYLHTYNELSWRWNPSINMKFIMLHIYLIHLVWGNLIQYFQYTCALTANDIRCGIFHLWHDIGTEKVLDFRTLRIFDFWFRDVHPPIFIQIIWTSKVDKIRLHLFKVLKKNS